MNVKILFFLILISTNKIAKLIPNLITTHVQDETFSYGDKFLKRLNASSDKIEIIENLKQMLIEILIKSKLPKNEDSVCLLFRLCAEIRPKILNEVDFYKNIPLSFYQQNIQILNENKRYHAMALVYHLLNQNEEALNIWQKYIKEASIFECRK